MTSILFGLKRVVSFLTAFFNDSITIREDYLSLIVFAKSACCNCRLRLYKFTHA